MGRCNVLLTMDFEKKLALFLDALPKLKDLGVTCLKLDGLEAAWTNALPPQEGASMESGPPLSGDPKTFGIARMPQTLRQRFERQRRLEESKAT